MCQVCKIEGFRAVRNEQDKRTNWQTNTVTVNAIYPDKQTVTVNAIYPAGDVGYKKSNKLFIVGTHRTRDITHEDSCRGASVITTGVDKY